MNELDSSANLNDLVLFITIVISFIIAMKMK